MSSRHATKVKSFNSQVNEIANTRLKLKRREKTIFFKLLGFLLRNDSPFPYSIESLEKNTGYGQSSLYESLNLLEKLRLIERVGYTSRVKFQKGRILRRICTLVQNRINKDLHKSKTLVQNLEELGQTSPVSGYKRTYISLKHKEEDFSFLPQELKQEIKHFKNLGLELPKDIQKQINKFKDEKIYNE